MSSGTTTLSYTPGGADDPNNPFHFVPSLAAAIVALVLYTLACLALGILTLWKRSWYMMPILIGAQAAMFGFGVRIYLCNNTTANINIYSFMNGCLIMAPVFYLAFQYLLYGRLVHAVGDEYSLIRSKLLTWTFLISDIIAFLLQMVGIGVASSSQTDTDRINLGNNIVLAGFVINLVSLTIFFLQIFYFDYRTRTPPPVFPNGGLCKKGWRQLLYAIYITSIFIFIRHVYRIVEFAQGYAGYLALHEVYFYTLDAIPILIVTIIYAIVFPGNGYLPANAKDTFIGMMNGQHIIKRTPNSSRVSPVNNLNFIPKF